MYRRPLLRYRGRHTHAIKRGVSYLCSVCLSTQEYPVRNMDWSCRVLPQPRGCEARSFRVDEANGHALFEGETFTGFVLGGSLHDAAV